MNRQTRITLDEPIWINVTQTQLFQTNGTKKLLDYRAGDCSAASKPIVQQRTI